MIYETIKLPNSKTTINESINKYKTFEKLTPYEILTNFKVTFISNIIYNNKVTNFSINHKHTNNKFLFNTYNIGNVILQNTKTEFKDNIMNATKYFNRNISKKYSILNFS